MLLAIAIVILGIWIIVECKRSGDADVVAAREALIDALHDLLCGKGDDK